MTRSELVQIISDQNPHLYAREVEQVVLTILDEMGNSLVDGDRVELRGFGTFFVTKRDARVGRNPKTGEAVSVDSKVVPRFKLSKTMSERLN